MFSADTLPSTDLSTLSFEGEMLGPAMQALPTDLQRRYVLALVRGAKSASDAALLAGYKDTSQGARLARDPRVQAALLEEAAKVVRVSAVKALGVLDEIAFDKTVAPRDRLKAADMILARGGFAEINRHQVEHIHRTDAQLKHELLAMAAELGMDETAKAKLIGEQVTDAEFEVVDPLTDIGPPRDPRGAPIDPEAGRTAEDRARDRLRKAMERAETPGEREARLQANREHRRAEAKRRYAEAQARLAGEAAPDFEGLEDILPSAPSDDPPGNDALVETEEEPME